MTTPPGLWVLEHSLCTPGGRARCSSTTATIGRPTTAPATITSILSNSVPTPIGEGIENLNINITQAYYGENDEAPLPGTTPNKAILTGGNLAAPGNPAATQTIDCSDSIRDQPIA